MLILEQYPQPWPVHTLAFAPDGQTLAAVSGRGREVVLWDLARRQEQARLGGHSHRVVSAAFSASGRHLASASSVGDVHVWAQSPVWKLTYQQGLGPLDWQAPIQLAFSPGDFTLLLTTISPPPQDARLWRYHACRGVVQSLRLSGGGAGRLSTGHRDEVSCLTYSPDGKWLATGSFDRSVRLHPLLARGEPVVLHQGQKVHYLAFSPDGRTLASGSPQGLVKVWDAYTSKKRTTLKGQARPLRALCYSPDGRTLATAGGEGTVRFWDVDTGAGRTAFDWGVGEVHAVAFAPDGMRAAAGGAGKIVVWDIDDWGL